MNYPQPTNIGLGWLTDPKFSAVKLEKGATFAMAGLNGLAEFGIYAHDVSEAAGALVTMEAGSVFTFLAEEQTRFYTGQQVAALLGRIEELSAELRRTA